MKLSKNQINVFFYGSPADGFTSYPTQYSNLVGGLDKSTRDYKLECKYVLGQNKTKILYVEYGLTGVGQDGKPRGGRNFGVWIELEGFKINKLGQNKLVGYIDDFIRNGLMKKVDIFIEENSKVKHYVIHSFNNVGETLDRLIEVFKEQFISDFNNYLEPISIDDDLVIDLIRVKPTKKKTQSLESIENDSKTAIGHKDKLEDANRKVNKKSSTIQYHKLVTLLLLLLISALIVSHLYHIYRSNDFKVNVEQRLNIIESQLPNSNKPHGNNLMQQEKEDHQTNVNEYIIENDENSFPKNEFVSNARKLIAEKPEMFYLSDDNKNLMFKIDYFKKKVSDNYKFSSSEIVVNVIEQFINESKINTYFSINRTGIKEKLKTNNEYYINSIDNKIESANSSNYPEIKSIFTDDFVVLINK